MPLSADTRYREAAELVSAGRFDEARGILIELKAVGLNGSLLSRVENDLGTLAAIRGDRREAAERFRKASELEPSWELPRLNQSRLGEPAVEFNGKPEPKLDPIRVAILSFLFNWPATGGGNVHTVELAKFLAADGYEVRHIYARYDPWRIGQVREPTPHPSEEIGFVEQEWDSQTIQARFRQSVDRFDADFVIVSDSWNFKPLLAEAVRGRRVILRLQAQECLCPLNNSRLLPTAGGPPRQCGKFQLATAEACERCVETLDATSGDLHRMERGLSGFGTATYRRSLRRAFAEAESVLVVNPLSEAMVAPFARSARVVTAGMDPGRFPWRADLRPMPERRQRIIFAGLTHEWIKGFHVLREACHILRSRRSDFELVVTDDPPDGQVEPWIHYVGWQSQDALPVYLMGAEIVAVPAVAQEALGRTAVEGMAAGRPVVASRIGGLPYVVGDGVTGLLFEPGDAGGLADQLGRLLDNPQWADELGRAGRQQFETRFSWAGIIERHYRPLLGATDPEHLEVPAFGPDRPRPKLGCVLAVRDRDPAIVERTLKSYVWQIAQPVEKILVDYGSAPGFSQSYQELCRHYGWRLLVPRHPPAAWNLAAAYNLAVDALPRSVEVVFKSDADVLLDPGVLAIAARYGVDSYCQFQYATIPEGVPCPGSFADVSDMRAFFRSLGKERPSVGQGLFACPLQWFRQVGGFDRAFQTWGYEDHDLRRRAERSLGAVEISWRRALLLHQWHPPTPEAARPEANRHYFETVTASGSIVRNGGVLSEPETFAGPATAPGEILIATRSMQDELYRISGGFLTFDHPAVSSRLRVTGASAEDYFRILAGTGADWVVNIDEDAFLIDPKGVMDLIAYMDANGIAACGMPDGGVVPIRRHNPVACNAYFNVLDLRKARAAWTDWPAVLGSRHRQEYEQNVPSWASRSERRFDDFEPYYGVFFSLLDAGERILYLDAETWRDGTSTLLKDHHGKPLLLHAWYAREWSSDPATRKRYEALIGDVERLRSSVGRPSPVREVH